MLFNRHKLEIPTADQALAGRAEQWFKLADKHVVLGTPVVTDESNIPDGYDWPAYVAKLTEVANRFN